tara:strand:+ start:23957 stop:24250 length:294 start_codon:yes stop_codon:yes gene_type:complete
MLLILITLLAAAETELLATRVVSGKTETVSSQDVLVRNEIKSIVISPCSFAVKPAAQNTKGVEISFSDRVFYTESFTVKQISEAECEIILSNDKGEN